MTALPALAPGAVVSVPVPASAALEDALQQAIDALKASMVPVGDAERTVCLNRVLQQYHALGWSQPFFLPMGAEIEFRISRMLPTAWITEDGFCYFNPDFLATLDDDEVQGLIAHELSHLIMMHGPRRGDRDPFRWNVAGDRAINAILFDAGIQLPHCKNQELDLNTRKKTPYCKTPKCQRCGVYPKTDDRNVDKWAWGAEQHYEDEEQDASCSGAAGKSGAGMGIGDIVKILAAGAGCGVLPAESALKPGQSKEQQAADLLRKWGEMRGACAQTGRQHGNQTGDILAKLTNVPVSRVKWHTVLRNVSSRVTSAHGRDARTWSRRNRRSTVTVNLPGWTHNSPKIAVIIDVSGSMSDTDLAEAVANVVSIVEASGLSVYLITHDSDVQWEGWIHPGGHVVPQVEKSLIGRGGTIFEPAYKALAKVKTHFDEVVHLTDGECGSWPEKPGNCKRLIVALLGSKAAGKVPDGAKVIDATINDSGEW